eukprot:gene10918-12737_t
MTAFMLTSGGVISTAWAASSEALPPLKSQASSLVGANNEDSARFSQHVQAASQATQELQNGFNKLQRLCTYGTAQPPPASKQASEELRQPLAKAKSELTDVQALLLTTAKNFSQYSRISKNGYCQYMPQLGPLAALCEGYRFDSLKFNLASRDMQRLTADAHQRLHLYEQFAKLEDQGCARQGFTSKLWETESTFLWPTVMKSPAVFKSTLSHVPAH